MTDMERAFLDSIAAAPDDDGPRLVLADWLEERGECERSEFIRLQCHIAVLEAGCGCGRCVRLRSGGQHHNGPCAVDQERVTLPDGRSKQAMLRLRESNLLQTMLDTSTPAQSSRTQARYLWIQQSLGESLKRFACVWDFGFRRGFVEEITLPCSAWLTHAAAIIEAVPMLGSVRLSDMTPQLLNVENVSEMQVWIFPRHIDFIMPDEFDDAMLLYHNSRDEAEQIMSRCCLKYARRELTRRHAAQTARSPA